MIATLRGEVTGGDDDYLIVSVGGIMNPEDAKRRLELGWSAKGTRSS